MKFTCLSFHPRHLLLLIIVFATLSSCGDAETTKGDKKEDRIIKIFGGNTNNGTLSMDDNGYSRDVDKYKKVIWQVQLGADLTIERIYKKDGSPWIFLNEPTGNGTQFSARVARGLGQDVPYVYNIEWKKTGETTPHTYDPKISVKPSFPLAEWLIVIFTALLSVLGIKKVVKRLRPKKLSSKPIS